MRYSVTIEGIPTWIDVDRLIAEPVVRRTEAEGVLSIECALAAERAADLDARLRGLWLGGSQLVVSIDPKLPRTLVRSARLEDARRRRDTTPGFERAGPRFDDEGRISLTPERLALRIAYAVAGSRVFDAGCGVGGNAIAFAREGCSVIAVERDEARLEMARHNAAIYGVEKAIRFRHADAGDELSRHDVDVVFVDPPWGEFYRGRATVAADYSLLEAMYGEAQRRQAILLAKLPPSFDPRTLSGVRAEAVFGEAAGDYHRVKLLLLHARLPRQQRR